MNFTAQNIVGEFPKFVNMMPKELSEKFPLVKKYSEFYGEAEASSMTQYIDTFVDKANKFAKDDESKTVPNKKTTNADSRIVVVNANFKKSTTTPKIAKPKAAKPAKAKATKPAKAKATKPKEAKIKAKPKTAKPKKEDNSEKVAMVSPEVTFIKRYSNLHGKSLRDVKERAIALLRSLQKAIIQKQIRKTSKYANIIMDMQKSLIKVANQPNSSELIEIANIEKYRQIAASQKVSAPIAIIKAFVGIEGKTDVKKRATSILKRAQAVNNSMIDVIIKSLKNYIDGKTETPEISAHDLQGLYGLAGIDCSPVSGQAMTSSAFLTNNFTHLPFTGKWAELIGQPSEPFKVMIYGKAGSGKSSLSLSFAAYLAKEHGRKVLYIANEEGFSYTFQEKLKRLNAANPNLYVVDKIPLDLSNYDVIFIDSVNSLGLEPENLANLDNNKSFIYVLQCTKTGDYRGSQAFAHDVDVTIRVDNMQAQAEKNRFGGNNKVDVL